MAQNSSHGRKKLSKQPSHADLLRPLSDSLSDALLLLDSNNRIVFANESAPKLLGRSRRSLLGNVVTTVMQLEDPINSTPIKKLPSVRKSSAKFQAVLEPHRYDATLTCIRHLPGFNQIKNATKALILQPGSPSSANSANIQHQVIGQLAMRIAHDFNNSLTTIVGNAELIQEALELISETDNAPSNINSILQMIHDVIRKCRETTTFIHKLQDYAQREPDTKEEIDLNASLQNILPIIQKLLGPKLKTEFLPGTELPQISIDESQLHQLLFIFVDDCKERVRTGTISIQTKQATLDKNYANTHPGARPGTYLKVTITDNAPAIPAGSLPDNFELFSAQTVDGAATGMRLAMIYAILKGLRGYIHVESIEHIGNKFEIYLPLARLPQQIHSMSAPPSTSTTSSKKRNRPNPRARRAQMRRSQRMHTPKIILVADDQPDIQITLRRCLARAGYETQVASNGNEALSRFEQLSTDGKRPALVIADLGLPGIDGKTLVRKIRQHHKDIPALLTTGHVVPISDDKTKTEDDQFDFLQKPFEPAFLINRIRELLAA